MNEWERELAELWPDLGDQTKADLLERLRANVNELDQDVRDHQRSYRKARNLLELGGLWATPQGIEAMRDPNSCEVLRQDLLERSTASRAQNCWAYGRWRGC